MKRILLLTRRYLAFNKIKTAILITCLTIVFYLPMAVQALLEYYEADLYRRAEATPLVYGSRGDRFDLVLKSLYFRGGSPGGITAADLDGLREEMSEGGFGTAIPLYSEFTGGGLPIVGTTLDYFEFRNLNLAEGTLPLVLGDAVLGAEAARSLDVRVGATVLTDQTNLYNPAAVYRVKLNITGVLQPSGTVDDRAIFCDLKSGWIIAGIGHGHTEVSEENRQQLMINDAEGNPIVKPSVTSYTEINRENMDSFHFHSSRAELPLTSILVNPASSKAGIILKTRYNGSPTKQILRPVTVVQELMGIVLQVKSFFDANFVLVGLAVILFLVLIILLSLKIRQRERTTLFRIGCARSTVALVQITELLIVFAVSAALALLLAWATVRVVPNILL